MPTCQVCGETYEEVDYPVVWPWPGACRCSGYPDAAERERIRQRIREMMEASRSDPRSLFYDGDWRPSQPTVRPPPPKSPPAMRALGEKRGGIPL